MSNSALLADLDRALELLSQVDERQLNFAPEGELSADIRKLTDIESYPTNSHKENLKARIEAVVKAGDRLEVRGASEYVSKIIPAYVGIAPPVDDWRTSMNKAT